MIDDDRRADRESAHDAEPDAADLVGEAAGGISGTLAGAAIGSLGGPIGTVIGGIAGAVGGWWTGRAIAEAADDFNEDEDRYYRSDYDKGERKTTDRPYDEVRPAYQLGHIAAHNPDYKGRQFADVEADLQKGWNDDLRREYGDWATVRPYAEVAYVRRVSARKGGRPDDRGDEDASRRA